MALKERECEEREVNAAEESGGEERRKWWCFAFASVCDCATTDDEALIAILILSFQFTPEMEGEYWIEYDLLPPIFSF